MTLDQIKARLVEMDIHEDLPVIHAGNVGNKGSLTYSIDKDGNLIMTETDDDGFVVSKQFD
ncbi:MAG: hypothetical protein V4501_11195 [Pseudomonadota bacterium]